MQAIEASSASGGIVTRKEFFALVTTLLVSLVIQSFGPTIAYFPSIKPPYVTAALVFVALAIIVGSQRKRLPLRVYCILWCVLFVAAGFAIYGASRFSRSITPFNRHTGLFKIGVGSTSLQLYEGVEHGSVPVFAGPARDGGVAVPIAARAIDGKLFLDIDYVSPDGTLKARIQGMDYKLYDEYWDANSDGNRLEIVNAAGVPQLQMTVKSADSIELRGEFHAVAGRHMYLRDDGIHFDPDPPLPPLKPFFRYPSSKYPGRAAR